MKEFKHCSVLVSGGAGAIGSSVARTFVEVGATVSVFDGTATEIEGVSCYRVDLSDAAAVEAAFSELQVRQGTPRLVVNCASAEDERPMVSRCGPMPLSQFQHAISAHLISAFNVIRVAAHHLKAVDAEADGERGVIVNIASISAFEGRARQVAHAASSGAIVSLTTQLAREFAPFGIRVVGIAPGVFEGDGPNSALADRGNSKFVPVLPNRIGRPEELAGLVVAVAGQVYINGVTIRQDGGLRMPPQV